MKNILKNNKNNLSIYGMAILILIISAVQLPAEKITNQVNRIDSVQTDSSQEPGFDEKPGVYVPLDLVFTGENGSSTKLKDFIIGPTILSLVYYKCPNACDYLLTGIASVLRSYNDKQGSEPNLLTITIDETETTNDAIKAKNIAFEAIQTPFPADKWHFLTGSKESIKKLTEAVGFHFVKKGDDFDHPIGLIILSPQGKVVRYIMGTDFLPDRSDDVAYGGFIRNSACRQSPEYCASASAITLKATSIVFNTLRVSATVIFTLVGIFVIYLIISGKKRRVRGGS